MRSGLSSSTTPKAAACARVHVSPNAVMKMNGAAWPSARDIRAASTPLSTGSRTSMIVVDHHGWITVDSSGHGTTFSVLLQEAVS